eukprot:TRINITY_DN10209_c0_g1_i4.p2 TRINITY_DN10209_c0_g1~~TRINITY_DN10209_c0_g1_i4.p2  ORF type:complete len:104 (-),score=8.53 TRINITY_DN10209_c0_g1_i4:321-632(-)
MCIRDRIYNVLTSTDYCHGSIVLGFHSTALCPLSPLYAIGNTKAWSQTARHAQPSALYMPPNYLRAPAPHEPGPRLRLLILKAGGQMLPGGTLRLHRGLRALF